MKDVKELIFKRKKREKLFIVLSLFFITFALMSLLLLIVSILVDGYSVISIKFLTSYPSRKPEEAGILSALVGSVYVLVIMILFIVPIGIGAAIYLEEFAPKNTLTHFIEINIVNLAGVPSIIYGLLGLEIFVRFFGLGRSILAGSLTLSLLVLPSVIIATREAIKLVPYSIREASLALGATKWQTVRHQVLPVALPGILTGIILAVSRAIGETAPLITIGALTYIAFLPTTPLSPFTVLPIQIFNWISRPQKMFHKNAAGAIIILLFLTFMLNLTAIILRNYYKSKYRL
ncbi:MAG: phosphate ABC transporter permease PstA [Candidatus Hydrothermales bacterium]